MGEPGVALGYTCGVHTVHGRTSQRNEKEEWRHPEHGRLPARVRSEKAEKGRPCYKGESNQIKVDGTSSTI